MILFFTVSVASAKDTKRPDEISYIATVISTQTAGKYTYIKLDEQGKEVWLATLPLNVSVGDKIEYMGGDVMKDFHSKGLDKTFDSIRFVIRIRVLNEDSLKDKQVIPGDEYHKNIPGKKQTVSIPKSSEIVKAEDGKTINEIISERDELKDKEVTLRAKVMKISRNITGKNWVTLRDGTGVSPDDKIIATTSEDVNIDDTLLVRAIVKTDIDLGSGYKYKVLLENAKFTK
ncbi:MAG: hypothetical protein L0958_02185 [Candidatus Mariimomonas ferrooxydans]